MAILHTLSNGLRVYADPMPNLESVALGVWAQAGSVDETTNEHGLAHLLEHMAFKGTKTRTARQIAEEVEAVGGYLNAATSHQRTGYYLRLLKEDLNLGLEILSDILINPLFEEGEFSKEKDVVIQEIGEAADQPDDVVFETLQSLSWGDHSLGRPILGTRETVRDHTTDALRSFMTRGYQPSSMVVAASGKLDPDHFIKEVEQLFGGLENNGPTNARSRANFCGGSRHDDRAIEQTHFAVAFPGVSSRSEDFYASRIFADVLGGGMSSRLFQSIREDLGLAYSVYAFSDSYDDCGLLGAYAGADAGEIPQIATAIKKEMEGVAQKVSDDEVNRTRAMLRASLLMGLESPATRIESAAGQLFRDGNILTPDEVAAKLETVSTADIKRCAERALAGPVALSMVGPGDLGAAQSALSI